MKLAKQGGYFSYVAGTAAVMLRRCTFSGGLVIHNTSTTLPAQKVSSWLKSRTSYLGTGSEQLGRGQRAGCASLRRLARSEYDSRGGHGGGLPGGAPHALQLRPDGPGATYSSTQIAPMSLTYPVRRHGTGQGGTHDLRGGGAQFMSRAYA